MWTPKGGKRQEMGMGKYPAVTLAAARAQARDWREAVAEGRDPLVEKKAAAANSKRKTFGEVADAFIESIKVDWKNAKHDYQWRQTLGESYCATLRSKPIADIKPDDVFDVLNPIWLTKGETAARLRGRIERVMDFALATGLHPGPNPATWRGNLKPRLPKRKKLQRGHHRALPYADVPAFMERLRTSDALAARALELTILCATRLGETLGARWSEIDLDKAAWVVPAERMKLGKAHDIPLAAPAVTMLRAMKQTATGEFVFAFPTKDAALSNMAIARLLVRMKVTNATTHGFRSSFRDWAGDCTEFPREVAEECLAHQVGNEVERSYRRGTGFEKRRMLLTAWADYLDGKAAAANVINMSDRIRA